MAAPVLFSDADAQTFLSANSIDPYSLPPRGYVFTVQDRQILVWVTPAGVVQVIDMTGMPAAAAINQPDYHTADESVLNNLYDELQKLPQKIPTFDDVLPLVAVGVVLGVALLVARQ